MPPHMSVCIQELAAGACTRVAVGPALNSNKGRVTLHRIHDGLSVEVEAHMRL